VGGVGEGEHVASHKTGIARSLRKKSTDAERLLWKYLRAKQVAGLKFRRQEPIGNYIVDFVCFESRVAVEVDGGQHSEERDAKRVNWLQSQGFRVIRFWNHEVLANIEGVLEMIRRNGLHQLKSASPSPLPSHQGRGDKRIRA
jgi:very-short-patch-repair endonuclease